MDPTYTNEGHACQGCRAAGTWAGADARAAGREPPMRIRGLGMTWMEVGGGRGRGREGGRRKAERRRYIRNCKMFGD